jgi:hypothetical protein
MPKVTAIKIDDDPVRFDLYDSERSCPVWNEGFLIAVAIPPSAIPIYKNIYLEEVAKRRPKNRLEWYAKLIQKHRFYCYYRARY